MKKITCFALLLVASLQAKALEVKFIDMEKLFQSYYKTVDANATLDTKRKNIESYVERVKKDLETIQSEFLALKKAAQNIALSTEEQANKYREMEAKRKLGESKAAELKSYSKTKTKEVKAEFEAMREEITEELVKYVKNYSKKTRCDLVVDISGKTLNGISSVIYYNKEKDITQVLLDGINRGHVPEEKEKETK